MVTSSEFIWTFPAYILATSYSLDGGREVEFDEETRFLTPESTPGCEPYLAVFTDLHLAEQFLEQSPVGHFMHPVEFRTPRSLCRFLRLVERHHYVTVDPSRRFVRMILIEELIQQLDGPINLDCQG